jgi:integrase
MWAAQSSSPALGSLLLADLTVDHVADWSAANERALAPTTAVIALITLKAVCRFAVRRGWLAGNPVLALEPGEKPRWSPGRVGTLEGPALARVLDRAGSYRPVLELLGFTGLRVGEALGLTWADADFEAGLFSVHRQLTRYWEHARLKTEASRRQIVLAPAMAAPAGPLAGQRLQGTRRLRVLCGHGARPRLSQGGGGVPRGVRRAGVRGDGRLSLHSLSHGYASPLIAEGLDVVFVSRQPGHANANVTLSVYAHLFAQREHGEVARQALEASYTALREGQL